MKFPITRESLQAFNQTTEEAEQKEEFIQRILECDITAICNELVRGMHEYSSQKRIIWRTFQNISQRGMYHTGNGNYSSNINIDEYLPRLVEKLKETFIGCDIVSDPLKTYIVIGWS